MAQPRSRVRNGLVNTGLVLVSFSLPFVLLECALRTMHAPNVFFDESFDGVGATGMPMTDPMDMSWDEDGNSPVHIRSENPRLVYEIRPNLDIYESRIRTNNLGFRGPDVAIEKPDDVYRICIIGDSIAFGWSEREEHTFPYQMQAALNDARAPDGRRFEVVNMGVGGYNADQELELLLTKALPLEPDLLLVQYCTNDIQVGADAGLWHHFTTTGSPAVDYVRHRLLQVRELFRAGDMVERSYREMVEVAEATGVPIAFLFFPPRPAAGTQGIYDRHIAFAREHGWPSVCIHEPFQDADDWDGLMADDYHPTPEGYALAAEVIIDFLAANGYIAEGAPSASSQ